MTFIEDPSQILIKLLTYLQNSSKLEGNDITQVDKNLLSALFIVRKVNWSDDTYVELAESMEVDDCSW